jgi:hypothetical protein
MLILGWILGTFMPKGPYPVLALYGEQSSGKTTTSRGLRSLTDPHSTPLRSLPKEERNLAIAAQNNWVLGLDNVSDVSPYISDALSQISTGGGFGVRRLYTNDDEMLISVTRPVLLNGIASEMISRPDLLNRTLLVWLPSVEESRKTEAAVEGELEQERPRIVGALLHAVSAGLRNAAKVNLGCLGHLPRMVDFAKWVEGCGRTLGWKTGEFTRVYAAEEKRSSVDALSLWPVLEPLMTVILKAGGHWEGIPTKLLTELNAVRPKPVQSGPDGWPRTPKGLSSQLRRYMPGLRLLGIKVTFSERTRMGHPVRISYSPPALKRSGEEGVPEVLGEGLCDRREDV